jgi:hypothetical protein
MPVEGLPRVRKPPGVVKIKKTRKLKAPPRPRAEAITADLSPQLKRAYYNTCGSPEERKEIVDRFGELLEEEPNITYPEAIFWWLLEKLKREEFDYQSSIFGGRTELGGLVVDFLVDMGGYYVAVLVNGNYWHNKPEQRERDFLTKESVIGQTWQGSPILYAVEIWESKLLSCDRFDTAVRTLRGEDVGQ